MVATVNGHPIMRADLEKAYQDQLGDPPPVEKPSQEQADSLRINLLSQLINQEIIEQRAAKMNLTATPAEVDAKLAEMKAPYTEEQFQDRLTQHHTTVDGFKRDIRRSLTQNKLLNKEINSKITVSDADITSFFNSHKADFNNVDTQYHLAQILVTTTPSAPNSGPINLQGSKATNDDEARKKIQALKNRIDSGEDFRHAGDEFFRKSAECKLGRRHGSRCRDPVETNPGGNGRDQQAQARSGDRHHADSRTRPIRTR